MAIASIPGHPLRLALFIFPLLFATGGAPCQFFRETTPLPEGRAFHGSAVLGDYLYVFGGLGENDTDASGSPIVLKARINANGDLAPWEPTTPLPAPRHYIANSTLVLDDVVYILGGASGSGVGPEVGHYNTAVYTRPADEKGNLNRWVESPPIPSGGLVSPTAVSTPGHLHLIGGKYEDDTVSNGVWMATLNEHGAIVSWEPGPPLPAGLWFHHSGVAGGRAFVWGGLTGPENQSTSKAILSAQILGSGRLGPWKVEQSQVGAGTYSGVAGTAGPYMFTFCPRYQGGPVSNDVLWTYVTPDGIQAWQRQQTALSIKVYHASSMDYRRGRIYVPGGRAERSGEGLATVYVLELSESARKLAEQGWESQLAKHTETVSVSSQESSEGESLTFQARERVASDMVAGFHAVEQARAISQEKQLPLVLYFNVPSSAPCQEQVSQISTESFPKFAQTIALGWADTSVYPQLAQQLGIYRVPSWIFYDRTGKEIDRHVGVLQPEQLVEKVKAIH